MRSWFAAAFLALATLGAAAQPQDEGVDVKKSRLRLLPASTVERSAAQQYNDLMRQAAQKNLLNNDKRQVERLRNIARALIPHSRRFNEDAQRWKWEVNLIRSGSINAFCMPGGKIAFFTGILDGLQLSDDEVAAVMGHEIAHALLEHGRARMSQQVLKSVGVSVAAALFNLGQLSTELLAQATNLAVSLPYARGQESDADLVGIELAARAGYDPQAAVRLWQKMGQAGSKPAPPGQAARGQPPQFLSTHPSHGTRIKDIEANLPRVTPLYKAAAAARKEGGK
ncbi:MAG TPA: M48 family metallopeptidase [Burkholderiales bacterium]|nr:M48 family metallopeptidase [Burkholderiales bacterium]